MFNVDSRPPSGEPHDSEDSSYSSEISDDSYSSKSDYSTSSSKDSPKKKKGPADRTQKPPKVKTLDDYPTVTADIRNNVMECSNNVVRIIFPIRSCTS